MQINMHQEGTDAMGDPPGDTLGATLKLSQVAGFQEEFTVLSQ